MVIDESYFNSETNLDDLKSILTFHKIKYPKEINKETLTQRIFENLSQKEML